MKVHNHKLIGLDNTTDLRMIEDIGGTIITVKTRRGGSIFTGSQEKSPEKEADYDISPMCNIVLPLPKQMKFDESIQYGTSMRWFQQLASAAGTKYSEIVKMLSNTSSLFSNSELTTNQPLDQLRYEDHQQSGFAIAFDLVPKNQKQSDTIWSVINGLRYFSKPIFDGLDAGKKADAFEVYGRGRMPESFILYEACLFDVGFIFGDGSMGQSAYLPYLENAVLTDISEDFPMNILPNTAPAKTTLQLNFKEILRRHANFYEKNLDGAKYDSLDKANTNNYGFM